MEIITATYALPMTNGCPIVKNGAIAVELGKIHDFGKLNELKSHYPGASVKKNDGCVLMPGLINAHCHLDLVSFHEYRASNVEDEIPIADFTEMLTSSIDFKQEAKPDIIIGGIQKGINRLIETGVSCVGDMTHFEGTFRLLREMGLRAIVFPEILAGRGEIAQQKFEIALALLEKYSDVSHDRVRVGLGPYAPYLLSRNLLKIIARHAKDASIPLVIHAAESFAEMEFFFDSQGPIADEVFPNLGWKELPPAQRKTPIEYLAEIGLFEAATTVVGGMQLSQKDFPQLARFLVTIVCCPSSNKLLKHGTFPYGKLIEHGIPIGLGTDIWHSRLGFNMWEEMRIITKEGAAPLVPSKEALKMATTGGARALGLGHITGSLEKGKKSDYIIVDIHSAGKELEGETVYDYLVKKTESHHVKEVVVGDKILKSI